MDATVQTNTRARYERTTDPRRMLTHKLLHEAIRKDWEDIRGFLPARTATYLEYRARARKAQAWNEGEGQVTIDLPLNDGWYVPDGNPFALPNGRKSSADDPEALYLVRHQDIPFSGPVGRDYDFFDGRGVGAFDDWSKASGVALVGREAVEPQVKTPEQELVKVADPQSLLQRAAQLRDLATLLSQIRRRDLNGDFVTRMIPLELLKEAELLTRIARELEKK